MPTATQVVAKRQRAPVLIEAVKPDDDWTGMRDAAARRKRQNRLNVRAYRKRKAEATQPTITTTDLLQPLWVEHSQSVILTPIKPTGRGPILPKNGNVSASMHLVTFPLSPDHLITVLQYNVLRGGLQNRRLLEAVPALAVHMRTFCCPRTLHCFPAVPTSQVTLIPPTLLPTTLQREVPHPHWIDIIPHPGMRDNLIRALGTFNPTEMWSDTVGGLFEGFPDDEVQRRGAAMWESPWDWRGWELSEGFVGKYGWVLQGCGEVLRATNRWRAVRGEGGLPEEV